MSEKNKRILMAFLIVITVNMLLVVMIVYASADLYKRGSTGDTVREIQTRLKSWGYYYGEIDGIYGSRTEKAVRYFQQTNGLSVDGQAGTQTLAAMGIQEKQKSNENTDVYLLARLISAEARGESYVGQVAVGAVVLNRIDHPSFPNSLSGVIYQTDAFTCVSDGQFNQPVTDSAYRAAQDAIKGWDPSGGAIYYYNPSTATSAWIYSRPVITTIGNHVFCA